MAHGQYAQSCGVPTAPPGGPPSVPVPLEVIPFICVSERYDSNVYYRPPTPGLTREDYVTNVSPNLQVKLNEELAPSYVIIGGFSETYVNNPGLNYVGARGAIYSDLTNSVKKLFPNASLRVSDNVIYTPQPPGFVNPIAGTNPQNPANLPNAYAQGLLYSRTNTLTNNGNISAAYATTASTSIRASYLNSIIRFGSPAVQSTLTLFDTTTQTGTVGGSARLSELDTLNLTYLHSESDLSPASSSISTSTSRTVRVDTELIGWERILSPELTISLNGGATQFNPGTTTWAGNGFLTINFRATKATITFSRSGFPNYSNAPNVTPAIFINNNGSLSATHYLSAQWQLNGSASYAYGSGGTPKSSFQYYSASVGISYLISRIWSAALGYTYMKFKQDSGSLTSDFDRNAVILSLNASWY